LLRRSVQGSVRFSAISVAGYPERSPDEYRGTLVLQQFYSTMKRVTGIGGIFFKTKDPEKLK